SIDFGIHKTAGTYTITGTITASGCTATMSGSAVININPVPAAFTVYGGGSYCPGGTVPHVLLSGSVLGTNYQLMKAGTPVGLFVTALGTALDFGAQPASGIYTITGTDALTGCSNTLPGSTTITA